MRRLELLIVLSGLVWMAACGGSGNGGGGISTPTSTITSVVVTCNPTSVQSGQQSQCSAAVSGTGNYSSAVTWSASAGTISSAGTFTAQTVSSSTPVTITAISVQDSTKQGTTTVTVSPVSTIDYMSVSCAPSQIKTGDQSQCTATVNGTGNFSQAVTWSGGLGNPGGPDCQCVSSAGVLTGPPVPGFEGVFAKATSTQDPNRFAYGEVAVQSPGTITSVTVSCVKTTINPGQDSLCTAVVTGTGGYYSGVNWSAVPGDVFPSGLYLAYQVQAPAQVTITATALQDGTRGQTTISVVPATTTPNNVMPITVDNGAAGGPGYVNGAFASVTVCVPGTYTCQTIDHILLDTGSSGLRLLASGTPGGEFNLTLPPEILDDGNPLLECAPFVSGYLWGAVGYADVLTLADGTGEQAWRVPVQVVGQPGEPAPPQSCTGSGTNLGTLQAMGANGILGIGLFPVDCGSACFNSFDLPNIYYSCGSAGCSQTTVFFGQVTNPVTLFGADSQGAILQLPAVSPPGQPTLIGSAIFGINTQSNNNLGAAQVFTTDQYGGITVNYQGIDYAGSFVDSGSNGMFFLNSKILGPQMPTCSGKSDWYCPASTQMFTATNKGTNGTNGNVTFSIDNANSLFQHSGFSVFPTLGGNWPISPPVFDWGLPFFYGRKVYTGIAGYSIPGTSYFGPLVAY